MSDYRINPVYVDEREMMMAQLLLGRVVAADRGKPAEVQTAARGLKVPPFVDAKPPLYQDPGNLDRRPERFDTVSGFRDADFGLWW